MMRPLVPGLLCLVLACAPGGDPGDPSTATLATTAAGSSSGGPVDPTSGTTTNTPTTSTTSDVGTGPGTTTTTGPVDPTVETGPASSTGATTGDDTTTTGTTGDGTTGDGTTGGSTTGDPPGLPDVGALVVLGDSISDGGGQPPFYYNLLRADLEARYGALTYKNNAQSGSKTDALLSQAKALPGTLPGPVVVVITSGGNDMKAALPQILGGLDGPAKAMVAANIDKALAELLGPDRFGPGVDVVVFEANIYDASDGEGNFSEGKCSFGQGLPPIPTDMYFDAWNTNIADAVLARDQHPVDMHMHFDGHGFNNPPNWYAADCTHPSTLGHDQLRRLFYFQITGEMLP